MMKRNLLTAVTLALAPLVWTPAARANLIDNGSFETPIVPTGSFTNFTVGSAALTGWTVVGPAGDNVSIVGAFTQNGVSFPAEDGNQWLDLTGDGSNSAEGVSQSVATTAGDLYSLSYYVGSTSGGGIFGDTSTVIVSLDGVPTYIDTNATPSPTTQDWEEFTHDFVASGASTTLAFQNDDPSSDNDNGLDNVVLTDLGPATPPVPEPASLALFGSALIGLGTLRRRKRMAT